MAVLQTTAHKQRKENYLESNDRRIIPAIQNITAIRLRTKRTDRNKKKYETYSAKKKQQLKRTDATENR